MRVLFWGTPEFATPPLRALLGEGFDVAGVVTQPDKPVGRSRSTVQPPPVKEVAAADGIPVLQPERLDAEFEAQLRALEPDISIVVAYGHMLPQAIIDLPPRGTLNIHASLLPKYRGAAPIQAALRDGVRETGVSIMRMVRRMDAGPVILQIPMEVNADETYGELSMRMSELGAAAVIEALALIEAGKAEEKAQDDSLATYAPKIEREHTRIDWTVPASSVARAVRSFDPRPGAFASFAGQEVKFFGSRVVDAPQDASPGTIVGASADGLTVACGQGAVRLLQVQPSGKRIMGADEWARGKRVAAGARFD